MRTTIDGAGRIVVPKALRDQLGLRGGDELEIAERDGHIEIEPAPTAMELEGTGHDVVAVTTGSMPVLTDDVVRDVLERVRR